MTYKVRTGTSSTRRFIPETMASGHLGAVTDERELFVGNPASPYGVPASPAIEPQYGLDSRRLWGTSSMGQQNTYTLANADVVDASGFWCTPKPYVALSTTQATDVVAMGVIAPYELADGGSVVIDAYGDYKVGSIVPRILARLSLGGSYVAPQYEMTNPTTGVPTDVTLTTANAFEWSSITLGLNAIAGYEALNLDAANLTPGKFQWHLRVVVRSLGRYAKWSTADDDIPPWAAATAYDTDPATPTPTRVTGSAGRTYTCIQSHTSSAAGTGAGKNEPHIGNDWDDYWVESSPNVWVEATLEWGALQHNGGGRSGTGYGFYTPSKSLNAMYHAHMGSPLRRGAIYTFMGQQWLCHAGSDSTALITTPATWANTTGYSFGDIVVDTSIYYRCISAHTSATGTDRPGVDAGWPLRWQALSYTAAYDQVKWSHMLAEEAPGIGVQWREYFVPAVSRATFSGFSRLDHTVHNEVKLELGGPQQVDIGTTFPAYGATTSYLAEYGICSSGGNNYAAKTTLYANPTVWPHFYEGALVDRWTEAPTGASPDSERAWRLLPTSLRDEMRVQSTTAYLFGRRNGVTERRV